MVGDDEIPFQDQNLFLNDNENQRPPNEIQPRNRNLEPDDFSDKTIYDDDEHSDTDEVYHTDDSSSHNINPEPIPEFIFPGYLSDFSVRPSVEWIYPSGNVSSSSEDQDEVTGNSPSPPVAPTEYVVNPNDIMLMLEVEGQVVQPRRCYLKLFGIEICSDTFVCILNPKILPLLIFGIIGIASGVTLPKEINSNKSLENVVINAPSSILSIVPSLIPVEPRVENITKLLHGISGDAALVKGSSQNKALNWVLFDDGMQLDHNSSNIVQRYVLMVFFYELTGEDWVKNSGFGSAQNECDWFGVSCLNSKIETLVFGSSNLVGQIPTEIGHLKEFLEYH